MAPTRRENHSATRLFMGYAALSLVPILALGLVLARSYSAAANSRGLVQAQSQAELFATTAIEPLLAGTDLRRGLSASARKSLRALADQTLADGAIPRLRVRDLDGRVVFSGDGSGLNSTPEDEAIDAGRGEPVALLTTLNADKNDIGPRGEPVVEVYLPLHASSQPNPIGVLEMYVPYAPIQRDMDGSINSLYRDLGLGLGLLYVVLAGLSIATTRRLRRHAEHNAYLAEHDALTGLPNRRLFHRRVNDMLERSQGLAGAIAIIDLDRFKVVNDSLGHNNGDALLVRLGSLLAEAIRPGDTVARLGGDEFGVILPRVITEDDATAILERLLVAISEPVEIRGLPLLAEASVGYALIPDDGADGETLLQRADIAMYVAKSSHVGVVRYSPEYDQYDADRLTVVGELRRALSNDELLLQYQPQIRLADGDVSVFEALIRWNHPRLGLLSADDFLPLAEQTGLMDLLTDWVVERALSQIQEWGPEGQGISVAVNISARNLAKSTFADRVLDAIERSGVSRCRLILEVTETALFTDVSRAQRTLTRLDDAGVRISLDDFGQGQTSLGLLSHLPLHELKLDRDFVSDMIYHEAHAAIVRSVVDLAHNLGFVVVAEGVENDATLAELRAMRCDFAQGYGVAPPMYASEAMEWLAGVPMGTRDRALALMGNRGNLRP